MRLVSYLLNPSSGVCFRNLLGTTTYLISSILVFLLLQIVLEDIREALYSLKGYTNYRGLTIAYKNDKITRQMIYYSIP